MKNYKDKHVGAWRCTLFIRKVLLGNEPGFSLKFNPLMPGGH